MKTNHKSSQDRKVKKKKKKGIKIVSDLGNGNPQKLIESNSKDRERKKKKKDHLEYKSSGQQEVL